MDQYVTGATIRALRESKGLTQAQLAERLFVSDKTVKKYFFSIVVYFHFHFRTRGMGITIETEPINKQIFCIHFEKSFFEIKLVSSGW